MSKDIHKFPFTEETILKLNIFGEFFREWYPVFIHHPSIKGIYIYDFFAGSGTDTDGSYGSPLILLTEAKGEEKKFCGKIKDSLITFSLNEKINSKLNQLKENVNFLIENCKRENNCISGCVYEENIKFSHNEFKELFHSEEFTKILKDRNYAKFVLLDQNGFSEVDDKIFYKFINSPTTDFIFFISSSYIKRFK